MRVVACSILFVNSVLAADSPRPIVLRAARTFDGKSGAIVAPGLVVVTDNRITGTGPDAQIPRDAEIVDLGDSTLLP